MYLLDIKLVMKTNNKIRLENARVLSKMLGGRPSFAKALNMDYTQLSNYIGKTPIRNIGDDVARRMEIAGGKQLGWMDKEHHDQSGNQTQITESNVSGNAPTIRPIPIISWVQAGAFVESNVIDETWQVSDYVYSTSNVSCRAFALRVEGDSMLSDVGLYTFPNGTIIICDPDQSASVGSFVIAKDTLTQATTFKRLDGDGFSFKLTALNEKYEPIPINNDHIRIIAKVIDSVQRLP